MNITIQRRIMNLMHEYHHINAFIGQEYEQQRYNNRNIYYPITYCFVVGHLLDKEEFPYTVDILDNKKKKWMRKYLRRIEAYIKDNKDMLKDLDDGYYYFNKL